MAEDLERIRARRRGHRGVATKYTQEAKQIFETESIDNSQRERLASLQVLLQEKLKVLLKLDEDILSTCATEDIEREIEESDTVNSRITETIERCKRIKQPVSVTRTTPERRESTPVHSEERNADDPENSGAGDESHVSQPSVVTALKPKLPKLTLPKFKGEVTRFRSFWDSYNSAIHSNHDISAIDKFNYLRALVEGPAARAIQGLALSAANYETAVEILQTRFGKTQQIISAHMDDLLKLPACTEDKSSQLRLIYDRVFANVRGLESLGINATQYGSFLIPVIMSKLPAEVRLQIARVSVKDVWEVEELLTVIKAEVEAREISDTVQVTEQKPVTPRRGTQPTASALVVTEGGSSKVSCVYCKAKHFSASCEAIKEVTARLDILRKEGRCFLCLSRGHRVNSCTSTRRCRKCNQKHHQSICKTTNESSAPNAAAEANQEPPTTNQSTALNVQCQSRVLLQTARTLARTADSNELLPVRILFDGGSERSYITTDLKKRLKLSPVKTEIIYLNTFGGEQHSKQQCELVKVNLQGRGEELEVYALSFPMLCAPPGSVVNLDHFSHLRELDLADCPCSEDDSDAIDVLIGADHYWDIVTGDISREGDGPVAISSRLGWLLSGPARAQINPFFRTSTYLGLTESVNTEEEQDELTMQLEHFWDTDSIGISVDSTIEDSGFSHIISFDSAQNRYCAALPWNSLQLQSTNYELCLTRLHYLRDRLQKNGSLLQEYQSTFEEQLKSGIIEVVPESEEMIKDCFFLPHHGVVRQDKDTTKLRIVFDGSAKTDNKVSLNDCLSKGPNHTPLIFDILLRFRFYKIALVADIEKAFHQILICPSDRDMLRFLWCKNTDAGQVKILQYRFCRLPFGLKPSPAILNAVLQKHLAEYNTSEQDIYQLLSQSFYVDDFVGGVSSDKEGVQMYQTAKQILKEGGFNLRKWHTNSSILQEKILQGTSDLKGSELPSKVKVLGLEWNKNIDCLICNWEDVSNYLQNLPPTKRSVLRFAAKIFDPLGILSPFTVRQKMMFQSLCTNKRGWDERLDGDLLKQWNNLRHEITALEHVQIPRCYFSPGKKPFSYQLHGFCDASEKAYATVIYLRTVYTDGSVELCLVGSKTRVAPLRGQTIPRLELLGAVILARLMDSVNNALRAQLPDLALFYWTDSYTVLCWIQNQKPWKQYVLRRVNEIRKLTCADHWNFCPGSCNPADIPSRGCSGNELVHNNMWWRGPTFLLDPQERWPNLPTSLNTEDANLEVAKTVHTIVHTFAASADSSVAVDISTVIDMTRFSALMKLLRVTALVLKFIDLCKKRCDMHNQKLTATDIVRAETMWIKSIQRASFESELQSLHGQGVVTLLQRQLNLFLDKEGIIRCQGRIDHATAPEGSKTPILMPTRHHFTELLIMHRHNQVFHDGIRETLNLIRETYWIRRGREAVKRVLRKCVVCRRYEGKALPSPPVPQLPKDRVGDHPPFAVTGVDFAGPLYVNTSQDQDKVYICLFTCGVTRAVHLELTVNLTANSFLQAFRRFASRRGLPTKMISDNAKTFTASAREVKKIVRTPEVQRHLVDKGVTWDFIAEKAPWWGGFWERLVRSIKNCLKKTIGRSSLTFEELRTLLIEIEAVLNNRPLTYIYDDENGVSFTLTPADLIYGRRISLTPSDRHFDIVSTSQVLTKQAKNHFRLLTNFNKQWSREYLLSLRENLSAKSGKSKTLKQIDVGDIVLIRNEGTPRSFWRLAKVKELIPGKDNIVRSVWLEVSTDKKPMKLRRPIQLLTPLEISHKDLQTRD